MVAASSNDQPIHHSSDPAFAALVTYSAKALVKKEGLRRSPEPINHTVPTPVEDQFSLADLAFSIENTSYAAPLSPLRDRDVAALADLFQSSDMAAIEADILANLAQRFPEPCWEDNPFDFLQDFL